MKHNSHIQAKPFLKWAGGKSRLISKIATALPNNFASIKDLTYIEPFIGGGAVLFWMLNNFQNISKAIINDINAELICTYRIIRDDVENLIIELERLQNEYLPLNETDRKHFYLLQRNRFNNGNISDVETAALMIFLNRTCFNGLYRVNSAGKFNVPHGRYKNPCICDYETLLADSKLLSKVEILCGDFEFTETYAAKNVLYYFDPPYRPLNTTSTFTSYTKDGFDDEQQLRLRNFCQRISEKQSLFIASNSDPKNENTDDNFFDNIYSEFQLKRVLAPRAINSKGNLRGSVSEIIVTNIL